MNRLLKLRSFLRYFATVGLHVIARRLRPSKQLLRGTEQGAEWYDISFRVWGHWKRHYADSHYYFLWAVVADRLVLGNHNRVLDVGCGPGQFAALLGDRGVSAYTGVDFSGARIAYAQQICPGFGFRAEDVFESPAFDEVDYNCVTVTEVLEHVERDLALLERIPAGKRVLASVPDFPSAGHVRIFRNTNEVHERYGGLLKNLRVDPLVGPGGRKQYFVIDGYKV